MKYGTFSKRDEGSRMDKELNDFRQRLIEINAYVVERSLVYDWFCMYVDKEGLINPRRFEEKLMHVVYLLSNGCVVDTDIDHIRKYAPSELKDIIRDDVMTQELCFVTKDGYYRIMPLKSRL